MSVNLQRQLSIEIESPSNRDGIAATEAQPNQQLVPGEVRGEEGQEGNPTKATRKKKSPLWDFFEECTVPSKKKKGEMENKVKCKACETLLTKNSSGTTTHWRRHLEQCDYHKLQQKSIKQQNINFPSLDEGDVDLDAPCVSVPGYYDPTKIRELICKMIIVHELPFCLVEYTWFNVLLKRLNPSYKKVSRNTIRSDCMRLYESEKEKLKRTFKDVRKISLTCDLWTSNQTICYMSLVAHYIDADWSMHCRVINFLELEPPHNGVVIANAISDCLASWRIEDKIASITFDNASSNDSAANLLLAKFTKRGSLWFYGKFLHIRCCAHILNLIVQDGLAVIKHIIDKVRDTVKYIKKSNNRAYKFSADIDSLNLKSDMGLAIDSCTRWGSTFKMLQSAFFYRSALDVYAAGDANYRWLPTPEEWNLYCEVNDALSVIHAATEEFSGSTYPTSNLFYSHIVDIKRVLGQLLKSKDPILKEMANAMLENFEKYWGPECNTLFAVALVLDPRFKMGMINYTFPALYEETVLPKKLANVESTLKSLHASYESELQSTSKENDATTQSTSTSLGTTSSHFSAASQFHEYMKSKNAASLPKSDLKRYLDDPVEDIPAKSFNLLQWWRMNELKYPIVAKLAKDILTIPITSVSSESAFSTGGRVISDYRSSLLPSTVQALVCTSSWIRGGHHKSTYLVSSYIFMFLTN